MKNSSRVRTTVNRQRAYCFYCLHHVYRIKYLLISEWIFGTHPFTHTQTGTHIFVLAKLRNTKVLKNFCHIEEYILYLYNSIQRNISYTFIKCQTHKHIPKHLPTFLWHSLYVYYSKSTSFVDNFWSVFLCVRVYAYIKYE